MSGDPEQEYFSDGMTEDPDHRPLQVLGPVCHRPQLGLHLQRQGGEGQEVSQELGVRYVLEGSVRKAESRVRITAQLVDATTGHHLWAERYDRELKDIFALQDEITQQIVGDLEGRS